MKLHCPKCGEPIAGDAFDLGRGIAVCRPCGEIVPLPAMTSAAITPVPENKLYKPEGFRFIEQLEDGRYEAVLPPNRLRAIPMFFFCLFWDGFMAVWYYIAIAHRVAPMALFGLLHLGVGIAITHQMLVALLNTRRLRMGDGRLSLRSSPVPLAGNLELSLDEIDSFVATDNASTSRNRTFTVCVNICSGSSKKLPLGTGDLASVQYAAASLNQALAALRKRDDESPYRG